MKKLKLYLDNCCFNRPYDNQEQLRIKLETLAKSYILDFENEQNPHRERKIEIQKWKSLSFCEIEENKAVLNKMNELILNLGLKPLDALHISCAIESGGDSFLTVDQGILKRKMKIQEIQIISPIDWIIEMED
jgi:predicted nucleic acid-binding protein